MKIISSFIKWYFYITTGILFVCAINMTLSREENIPSDTLWKILLSGFLTLGYNKKYSISDFSQKFCIYNISDCIYKYFLCDISNIYRFLQIIFFDIFLLRFDYFLFSL